VKAQLHSSFDADANANVDVGVDANVDVGEREIFGTGLRRVNKLNPCGIDDDEGEDGLEGVELEGLDPESDP